MHLHLIRLIRKAYCEIWAQDLQSRSAMLDQLGQSLSFNSVFFDQDEVFDSFSGGNGRSSVIMMNHAVYETGRAAGGGTAALLESLQVQASSAYSSNICSCSSWVS